LMVKYAKDVYPEGTYGLRNNHNLSVGPDHLLADHSFTECACILHLPADLL
jgi:hypothetical protein